MPSTGMKVIGAFLVIFGIFIIIDAFTPQIIGGLAGAFTMIPDFVLDLLIPNVAGTQLALFAVGFIIILIGAVMIKGVKKKQ